MFIKDIVGIILIYDITNELSFKNLSKWIECCCLDDSKIVLVGNKSDLEKNRKISFDQGKEFAEKNDFDFVEISTKMNRFENVETVFKICTVKIMENIKNKIWNETHNGIEIKEKKVWEQCGTEIYIPPKKCFC